MHYIHVGFKGQALAHLTGKGYFAIGAIAGTLGS